MLEELAQAQHVEPVLEQPRQERGRGARGVVKPAPEATTESPYARVVGARTCRPSDRDAAARETSRPQEVPRRRGARKVSRRQGKRPRYGTQTGVESSKRVPPARGAPTRGPPQRTWRRDANEQELRAQVR
eukprot:scaffold123396_cov30-Tisochrysis_lutea.AAC.10